MKHENLGRQVRKFLPAIMVALPSLNFFLLLLFSIKDSAYCTHSHNFKPQLLQKRKKKKKKKKGGVNSSQHSFSIDVDLIIEWSKGGRDWIRPFGLVAEKEIHSACNLGTTWCLRASNLYCSKRTA